MCVSVSVRGGHKHDSFRGVADVSFSDFSSSVEMIVSVSKYFVRTTEHFVRTTNFARE